MRRKKLLKILLATMICGMQFAVIQSSPVSAQNTTAYTADSSSEILEGTCSEDGLVKWKLEDGVLTVSGTGAMNDYYWYIDENEKRAGAFSPWEDYSSQITEVIVKNGVTRIGKMAFYNCYYLKKLIVADTVKEIADNAFTNCESLAEIDLGSGVETIGENIFWLSPATSLVLPKSLKNISEYSLGSMWSLTDIFVEEGNTVFQSKNGILYSNDGTTLVKYPAGRQGDFSVPEGTTKIESNAFSQSDVTSVIIPEGVTEIGKYAFWQCKQMTSITFPSTLKTLESYVCMGSSALTSVTIPEGVTEIKKWAFHDCSSLTKVTVPSTVQSIDDAFPSKTDVTVLNTSLVKTEDGSYIGVVKVNVSARENYKQAFEVLDLVNKERTAAGKAELTMDQSLLETAMMRAAETVIYFDKTHNRPSGLSCITANTLMFGENIAMGSATASGVMNQWMNSAGHKANILDSSYKSIGIGCVTVNGITYWVQCFGYQLSAKANSDSYSDQDRIREITVNKSETYYTAKFSLSKENLVPGETADVQVAWQDRYLKNSGVTVQSSDSSICSVENEKICAKKEGTVTITVFYPDYKGKAVSFTVNVSSSAVSPDKDDTGENTPASTVKRFNKIKLSNTQYTYDGKAKNPVVKVYEGSKLLSNNYYTVSYKNNKKIGYATVIVKGKGKYAGCNKTAIFKIIPQKVSLQKCKSTKKKQITLTWKIDKQVQGYQYQICTNRNFSGNTLKSYTIQKPGITSATLKNLKSKKTYYVRIRSYKKANGKYLYGNWSTVKKAKVK